MSSKKSLITEKNTEPDKVSKILEDTLKNIKDDRARVSAVLDAFVNNDDPDKVIFSAESVARLADSLVKNNQLMVNIASLISKKLEIEKSDEIPDFFESIGDAYSQ